MLVVGEISWVPRVRVPVRRTRNPARRMRVARVLQMKAHLEVVAGEPGCGSKHG